MRRAARDLLAAAALLLAASCASSPPLRKADNVPASAIQKIASELTWSDAPPTLPAGTKVQILEGSPQREKMFTMRLRVPAGAVIRPHTHPREERVTILSGEVAIGFGNRVDPTNVTRFTAGGFYVNPPDVVHYVIVRREAALQLTGMGPWGIEYVGE